MEGKEKQSRVAFGRLFGPPAMLVVECLRVPRDVRRADCNRSLACGVFLSNRRQALTTVTEMLGKADLDPHLWACVEPAFGQDETKATRKWKLQNIYSAESSRLGVGFHKERAIGKDGRNEGPQRARPRRRIGGCMS